MTALVSGKTYTMPPEAYEAGIWLEEFIVSLTHRCPLDPYTTSARRYQAFALMGLIWHKAPLDYARASNEITLNFLKVVAKRG